MYDIIINTKDKRLFHGRGDKDWMRPDLARVVRLVLGNSADVEERPGDAANAGSLVVRLKGAWTKEWARAFGAELENAHWPYYTQKGMGDIVECLLAIRSDAKLRVEGKSAEPRGISPNYAYRERYATKESAVDWILKRIAAGDFVVERERDDVVWLHPDGRRTEYSVYSWSQEAAVDLYATMMGKAFEYDWAFK